jgi:hypothetical protein
MEGKGVYSHSVSRVPDPENVTNVPVMNNERYGVHDNAKAVIH